MNILAFGAHPDDIEFRCGGTLAKYHQQGHKVTVCIATNGNIGSFRMSKAEIAAVRKAESQNSCNLIGAELLWLNEDDEFLFDTEKTRLKFIEAVRIAKPDVIFAPPYYRDYNPDHDITGYLAFIARINATIALIQTEHPPIAKKAPIFFCTPMGANNFIPEYYVDITGTMETKKEMFLCHKSQQGDWCRDAFGVDYLELLVREGKFYAAQCGTPGVEYVEGFQLCKSWPIIAGAHTLLP